MSTRLLLCAILLYLQSFAQTTNAFRVSYNQALFDLPGNAIEALTPSYYVFAGTNMNFLPIYGTITQVDDLGALVWSKRYSDASIGFQINDIKKDPVLSEYYVCGGSESGAAIFMRVDATGAVVVSKKFSISEADGAYLNRVVKTSDGGYVAVGYVTGHDPDGAGPEIKFSPINYIDANGDPQTEVIGSPLIVKFNSNGDHVWHHVFRYYTAATKTPAQRIYNDASLNDVVEVADGYIAVGQYDVNQHNSATNSDGDDATPNDALIIKTTTAGVITYHKQIDAPNTSTSQSSKYLSAISKTSVGDPIAAGSDDGYELIMKYAASGGFGLTFSRRFRYSTSFGFITDPVDISQVYEVDGSTDLVTMGMYLKVSTVALTNSLHRVNAAATTNTWARSYAFSLATILPRGGKTSDGGYIMNSTVMGGANFDYHLIKTDPTGQTPITGCAAASFTPTASAGPTTIADPYANNWSGTVGPQAIAVTATAVTPTATVQCSFTSCTAPPAPIIGTITQPTCSVATGSVALSGLPGSGAWTVTASPGGGTITGTGTTGNFTGLTAGTTYTFTVTNAAGCTSVASANVGINAQPATPTTPVIGTITQPTCSVATGSVALSGLPATGTWTVTAAPGGATITGTGTTGNFTGLTAGTTYTFTVTNAAGCTSVASATAGINAQPATPTAPVIGTITQPTCAAPTGTVALSGLPASGSWTVTAAPGGATITGTGTTGNFSGLTAGTTYTFTVTNAGGCNSTASANAAVSTAPGTPTTPVIGTITQPTCSVATGSVALSGLPATGTWTVTAAPGGGTITGTGTTGNFTGLTAGTTYTFTVTNVAGCTSVASANAAINAQPATPSAPVIGVITQPTCSVATGSVALSGLPASGSWTVTASPGGATISGSGTTGNFTGLTAGTTYTFTVTNVAGCTSVASANAAINAQPATPSAPVIGTITQPTCNVATGSVALSGLPATGSWTVTAAPGGATISGSGTTGNFTGLAAGTTYTFTVTNAAGCTSVASTNAVINTQPVSPSAPIIGAITQPTCSVATGSVALSGLPVTGTWTVTASPGGAIITGSGTTGDFTGLSAGTTYTFTVTNSTGCTSVASTSAIIDVVAGAPIITLDNQQNVNCNGGTTGEITIIVSSGQAPYTYLWTPNVGSGATVSNLAAGIYTVLITDDLGCTATDTYTITEGSLILIDETIEDVICGTSLGSISTSVSGGTGPYDYLWTPNGEITTGLIDLASGNYGITVTDDLGCVVTENYSVGIVGSLAIDADPNYSSIDEGESVQLTVTGGTDYTWTPSTGLSCTDCSNPIATPSETTTYYVTSTDASGCAGGDTVLIEIKINCGDLFVPNIFSPNGDMNNDYLCIYGSCVRELKYAVYDRWGEKVFETEFTVNMETKNYDEVCWDGTFRGKPLNTGVYAYKIYAELDNGDILEESGNITLVK